MSSDFVSVASAQLLTGSPGSVMAAAGRVGAGDVDRSTPVDAPADLLDLLYRQMRKLAGPRPDLDDLVQAAAERALRSYPRFAGRSALSTWTYSIAYRTLLDHQRWFRRWARRFSYAEDRALGDPPCESPTTEQRYVEARRAASLHRALDRLPPAKRAAIVLHDLEELEMKEVAAIVGTNERTVRSRLRDGRRKLLSLLASDPIFDPAPAETGGGRHD